MTVHQLYTGCLSEAAYFVESDGEAIVIDPLRDTAGYLQLAEQYHARIKYIFETHFHADFVSGHLDLQKQTGAPIVYGPATEADFPFHLSRDGEVFTIGKVTLEVLHTPGHTIESACYLLRDETGKPYCIFTGDTLFAGDIGRPDLSSGNLSSTELASVMYDTIQNRILPLADDIIVYPAHGAGSSCGKNISSETATTIGDQKRLNYALQPQTREEFIRAVTQGLNEAPPYFSVNARINKQGYESLDQVIAKGLTPLTVAEVAARMGSDVLVLDTRPAAAFVHGFIPGSLFIGLEGRFAEWAGTLVPFHRPLILVTEPGREEESIVRLARVGFDKVEGVLEGGFEAWQQAGEPVDMIIEVDAAELALDYPHDDRLAVVDVRKENEFAEGHVKDAINLPLSEMTNMAQIAQLGEDQNLYVHCGSGYRSTIALSILKQQGYHNVRNVSGGWAAIKSEPSIPTEKNAAVLN